MKKTPKHLLDRIHKKAQELGFTLDDEDKGFWLKFDCFTNGLEITVNLQTRMFTINYFPADLQATIEIDQFFELGKISIGEFLAIDNQIILGAGA